MACTETLMSIGSWSLSISSTADKAVRDKLVEFGHIVITPAPIDPNIVADATILSLARYVGVLLERPSSFQLQGAGLAWWLGSEDGVGPVLEAEVVKASATMSAWITDLVPSAIATGTLTNTSLSTLSWTAPKFITSRQAIDYVCTAVGAEWRVRNGATIDVAVPATLFNVTPNDVVIRKDGGPDLAMNGLQVDLLTEAMDASNYTTKILVVAKGDGPAAAVGSASQSTAYNDLRGNDLVVKRVVDSPTTDGTTDANTVATNTLNLFSSSKRPVSLSTDTYDIGRYVIPGDYLYVYDPVTGLVDTTATNQVYYRGQLLTPTTLRVYSYTWPVQEGMGVYYRDSVGVYTDLSRYVEFESGSTNYEVGDIVRSRSASLDIGSVSTPVVTRATSTSYYLILVRNANQAIASGATGNIAWDGEISDTQGLFTPTSATITLAVGGTYAIRARTSASAGMSGGGWLLIATGGQNHTEYTTAGNSESCCSCTRPLNAGDTIVVTQYNGHSGSLNFTGTIDVMRVAD